MVTSTADSGPGTLRQALLDAQLGDTIKFEAEVFPPDDPATIAPASELPWLTQGYITIDASDAGVILDGSEAGGGWTGGVIIDSEGNTVRGLQIIHFTGAGIILYANATNNIIGGDGETGSGPLGQGNLSSGNADGIAIFGSSGNTFAGNLIGTDATGQTAFPNRTAGIFLQDGAEGNVIGLDNVIAFNGDTGVDVRTEDSPYNTITGNSIHDNVNNGIKLPQGATFNPIPPQILEFDLAAGTLAGGIAACVGCQVEVFSDSGDQGGAFEGQAVVDVYGAFTLNVGRPFAGPSLTATVTTADGTTSIFSVPTVGERQMLPLLQRTSPFPRTVLTPRRTEEQEDTWIGDTWAAVSPTTHPSPEQLSEHSAWLGHTWICLTFGEREWSAVQVSERYSPLSFSDFEDQVIDHLNERGITIVYNLTYFDENLQFGPGFLRFQTEQEIQDYLNYAEMVATHFRGRIQYYETWNEPNNFVGQQGIAVEDYINVIRRLVPVIRAADPEAKVIVGGGSDLRDPQVLTYVMTILESDIMPLVDGIAVHPMYGSSPDYDELRQYYYDYPALVQRIKDTASAHGFTGEYFSEEMTWRTSYFTTEYEEWTYTETVAAKYYARGIVINRGLGLWAGIGGECFDCYPTFVQIVQNLNMVLAGAEPAVMPLEIDSEAALMRSYAFSLSNGDRLVAIWTDGVAVNNDPGILATLSFADLSAQEATGIDVLFGFEQPLIVEAENGDLVIRDLLIRDYPTILWLSNLP